MTTPLRENHPDHKTFQWVSMVTEIGKCPGEKQFGWRAFYLNPGHNDAEDASKKATFEQVKKTMSRIKSIVKSNFKDAKVQFNYKARKDGYNPERLESIPHTDPNNSGMLALLTFVSVIQRVRFIEEPDPMTNLLKRVAGTFIN